MIEVKEVSKHFNGVKAVDKVNFRIEKGEVVGFLGPNGAGKTTLMRLIVGFLEPTSGEVLIEGDNNILNKKKTKQKIGYLAEDNPLYEEMLVNEYLQMMAGLKGFLRSERKEIIKQAVKETAIESVYYRPINELSKGFRQRVGLAQAILGQPEILIMDEPTEGLDPNQRVDIRSLITSLGKEKTVVVSTHVLSEATAMCDRLIILDKGRVVADGGVEELQRQADKNQRLYLDIEAPDDVRNELLGVGGVVDIIRATHLNARYQYTVLAEADKAVPPRIFKIAKEKNWVLWNLSPEKASLENIFRKLTKQE